MRQTLRGGSNRQILRQARAEAIQDNWAVLVGLVLLGVVVTAGVALAPFPVQLR